MKRRSFLTTSVLGASGLGLTSCKSLNETNKENAKANFSIKNLAPKPPLGWNSFDSYGVYLHHEAAMENLKAMVKLLKPHGYEYFVIDGGWYGEFKLVEGTLYPKEKHAQNVHYNEYGVYQPSKTYFPKGFGELVEYAHANGIKMGIHLMRGIPRKAVEENLPVKGTNYRAKDIADVKSICAWNHQNYGIDMSKPGAQEYYDSVYAQIAEWGFDFVKVDDIAHKPKEVVAVANAVEKCGRPMVYSLSPGGSVSHTYLPYYKRANMLRITHDIWDRREDFDRAFNAWRKYQGIAYEGFWPDLDMIPFGQLLLMSPEKYKTLEDSESLAGLGYSRQSNMTPAQMRTFITVRSLAASPLMMGGDLPTLDDYSLALITDKEMLACNQNGECGISVFDKDGIEVWITRQKDDPTKGWIGIFNRNLESKSISLGRIELGLFEYIHGNRMISNDKQLDMLDVWNNSSFVFEGEKYSAQIEADDVVFLRFTEKG
jgi:alpha-galactosidase